MAGFQAVRSQNGGEVSGKLETYDVAAAHTTVLAIGDAVSLTGTSDAVGRAGVDASSTTGQFLGIVAGFEVDPDNLTSTGLAALTQGKARVNVDSDAIYTADVANGPLVVANVGLNANMVVTAATVSGGLTTSNMTVNATGVATTVTLPWRIIGLLEDDDGVLGNRVTVQPNTTTVAAGTVGV